MELPGILAWWPRPPTAWLLILIAKHSDVFTKCQNICIPIIIQLSREPLYWICCLGLYMEIQTTTMLRGILNLNSTVCTIIQYSTVQVTSSSILRYSPLLQNNTYVIVSPIVVSLTFVHCQCSMVTWDQIQRTYWLE